MTNNRKQVERKVIMERDGKERVLVTLSDKRLLDVNEHFIFGIHGKKSTK